MIVEGNCSGTKSATKADLEALILEELRKSRKLTMIEMIAIIGPVMRQDCNWEVRIYPKAAGQRSEIKRIIGDA